MVVYGTLAEMVLLRLPEEQDIQVRFLGVPPLYLGELLFRHIKSMT